MSKRTGPQYYPAANRNEPYWHEDNFPGSAMEANVALLHTIEGTTVPTYADSQGRRGASAPNITGLPGIKSSRVNWYQHYRVDTSSRALENRYGGVETNTNNVFQIELVGTCDPKTAAKWEREGREFIYWPQAPKWALDEVAELLAWLHEEHGVPLVAPKKWPSYPTSYGNGGGQRMSNSEWNAFRGVCGHMHPPENSHGDPGSIDIQYILKKAKSLLGVEEPKPPTKPKPTDPPKAEVPAFPGRKFFAPGQSNKFVTQLGKQLVKRGFGKHYKEGPGPRWGDADRLNVRDFQRSRAELKGDADGYPGPLTWKLLFS